MAIHSAAPRWVVVLQNTNLNLFVQATAIGCGKSCRSSHNILQSSQLVNGHSRFLSVGYDGDIDSWDWGALPDFTKRNNGSNNRCGGQYSGSLDRCRNIEAFNSEPKAWFLSETETESEHFRYYFAMGRIRGTLRIRSHIFLHRATTKYFSNSFVFKPRIEKEGLPRDSPAGLGAGGPEFKSRRPDQNIWRSFFILSKVLLTQNRPVEFRQAGGLDSQVVWFPRVRRMMSLQKTRGGRRAIQKLLNGRKLIAGHLTSMAKIQGTLCISGLINLRKCKSVITHWAQHTLHSVSQFAF